MDTRELAVTAEAVAAHTEPREARSLPPVKEAFEALLRQDPERTAVIDDRGHRLSRAQLRDLADAIGAEMQARGLAAGDVVLICMPNWTEWLAVYLAAVRADLVPATAPVTSDPGSIAYMAGLVGAKVVVCPARHRGRDFAAESATVAKQLNRHLHVLLIEGNQQDRTWREFAGPEVTVPDYPPGMAHILFSSSTTGSPKAIAHSEASLGAYNQGVIERYGVTGSRPIFMPSPLGHSTGVWHGARMAILTGAELVIQDRWDPLRALELVQQHRCAITVAATPFLADLVNADWDSPAPKLADMGVFLCGGAPIPPELIKRAQEQMPKTLIASIWAMSEGGATSSLPDDPPELIANSCGKVMPGVVLETITPDGKIAPRGTEGEIVMRTPSLFLGYVGQDDLYRESFTEDGFFRTGDLGIVDDRGYLRLTGRVKDIIIRGGVNIAPVAIENALANHEKIARVAVVGRPDERLGERICAVVQPHGEAPTLDELTAWLSEQGVPRRLWPESLVIVSTMPQTPAGKIRKNVLREMIS